jgi:putative mRNA 3-end processing factor
VRCDCFITESTFGLPVYRWRPQAEVLADINPGGRATPTPGRASLLLAYSFGKAQRLLAGVDAGIGPIVVHDSVHAVNAAYRDAGVTLPHTQRLTDVKDKALRQRALVLAPPAVRRAVPGCAPWATASDAFASGWMQLRGGRRRQGLDRGFALSDHADWPGLQAAIAATGASRVIVTHGYEAVMVRWLLDDHQQGLQARRRRLQRPRPAQGARRVRGAAGRVGQRQEHAAEHPGRAGRAHRGEVTFGDHRLTTPTSPSSRATGANTWASCSSSTTSSPA